MRFVWNNREGEVDGPLVYVMYSDNEARPLYIGVTEELINRLAAHRNSKRGRKVWYRQISEVLITHCDSRAEAEELERKLIRELNPIHNVTYARAGA